MSEPGQRHSEQNGVSRVAMIGLGGAAERILLPAIRTLRNVELVSGCDTDVESRERAKARWSIPRVYSEPAQMLEQERPEVAIVATPPLTHSELCVLALERGCHVFCEKPFAPSIEEADRVIAAARSHNRMVAVNNQYSQMPIYRTVKDLLVSGRPGRLYHIDVWQRNYLLPEDEGGWKAALQPQRVLYEFGTHALDLICQFFTAFPVSVSARIPKAPGDVGADVLIVMRLDFPEGRVANMVINRVSHAPEKYLEMRLDCEEASLRASLGGVARLELGWNSALGRPRLRFSLTKGGEVRWERDGRSRQLARQSKDAFYHAAARHFSQFLSAIENGHEPPVSAAHAREVLRSVFAGYRSASEGGELVRLG